METNYMENQVDQDVAQPMTFFARLKGIFISPVQIFENIKYYPKMLFPLIYASVISMITVIISMPLIQLKQDKMYSLIFEKYGVDLSQAQSAMTGQFTIIFSVALTPVGIIIAWLIGSLFIWILSKMLKGKANIKKILSLNAHVMMLTATGTLLAAPIGLLLKTDVNVFSLAVLFPNGAIDSFMYNVLQSMELFGIWGAVITAIGLAVINDFSKAKGYITSFVIYIMTVLYSAASLTMTFWMYDLMFNKGMM